ncbi:hypothetical protein GXW82_17050 [Streptacidiphilus sp. 4-A2]|nr:hypothetical protein [Streptacidiphilus sp. 4-A2]
MDPAGAIARLIGRGPDPDGHIREIAAGALARAGGDWPPAAGSSTAGVLALMAAACFSAEPVTAAA